MMIGDRVTTPVGSGIVVGWYSKGARKRVTVAIDGGGDEPEVTFDEDLIERVEA
ncbi:MAG TPA: hypothetical protein QF469_02595 [Sphingomonas sanguinis]|uniref:hypothetical protein n=1 Tax=Sphingomonas sanguinis TaxID=33051 RepID=UPI002AC13548|nr:hypothetical protein [Sphingomonas sanguinis]